MGRFDLKKLNELEGKEQYRHEISNRFAAFENLDDCHSNKMGDTEFLKAMLAEMNANMKTNEEHMKEIKEDMKTTQERAEGDIKTDREEIKQEIRAAQEQMQEMIRASQEKMEAVMQFIWAERDEAIQQRGENVMTRVNHETQSLQKACQETTACHEATETDTEKTEPDPGMMQSVRSIKKSPRKMP
jgi:hypothetical protein